MGLGVDRVAADTPYRIALAGAVFVDREQGGADPLTESARRIVAFDHLQGFGVDLSVGAVEVQAINALALASG